MDHINGNLFQANLFPAFKSIIPLYDLDIAIQMHVDRDKKLRDKLGHKEMVEETISVSYIRSPYQRGRKGQWVRDESVTEDVNIRLGNGKIQRELTDYKDWRETKIEMPYLLARESNGYLVAIFEPKQFIERRQDRIGPTQMPLGLDVASK